MTDKVGVVTGAARGLGKSFSEALLKKKFKVYFCDIDVDEGNKTRDEFAEKYGNENVDFKCCDVQNESDFTEFFNEVLQKYGSVDLMVNNAGIVHEKEWRKCIDINLGGVVQGSMLAIDHMKQSNGGKGGLIVNVSSMAGIYPLMYSPVYSATKSAIITFTRGWAMNPHVNKNGIRMSCLCPAFADTDILKNTTDDQYQGKELSTIVMNKIGIMPIERVTEAFLELIDDCDNNGKAMIVTPNTISYFDFPNPFSQNS